ncbi:acyltransferase [Pseudohalioglobus sediminis]|uniref:Acyltransferase n=1 Tax=Pseudohalioglobus sediminis TaxID=2606449 RepID=A0A5B0WSI7_9GAMM|nr:acyltransferase family protein [Pseudohalioglobus sediminis]KAA1188809.1 acyltransferase [Pseudohalioglobus sediminis]
MTVYRADIDGLRAFSILAVVVYHAFPTALPGGFVGVDVFFVISGYLISGIILKGQATGDFSLATFYRRRIQRIVPALLLVLVFCLAAGWWILLPYEYAMLGKQTAASAIFAPNILFWSEAGYFDTDSRLKPLLHLWSLGVEEQFYLVWPLVLVAAARFAKRPLLVVAVLLLMSFIASTLLPADPAAHFFLPQFRIWELLLGAALAASGASPGSNLKAGAAALLGITLLVIATYIINSSTHFPGWWALLPTLGAALLIFAGTDNPINRFLGWAPLVFVGKISFPLYLWHWPLLTFARLMESGEPSAALRVAIVIASVFLAWLSYRLVETPLRYHPARGVPAMLLTGLLLTGAAGAVILQGDGVPSRTAGMDQAFTALYWKEIGLHRRDDCSDTLSVPGRCLSDGKPPAIAVIGDSHSTNTFFALQHAYRESSEGIIRLGRGGCPPLLSVAVTDTRGGNSCMQDTRGNLDWVLENPAIHTVYLSSMGPPYINPRQSRYRLHYPDRPELQQNEAIFAAALGDTTARLLDAGKEVVLVIDWPGLGMHPETCVDTRPVRLTNFTARDCSIPRARYERSNRRYRQILQDIASASPQVKLWDTSEVFCDAHYCYGMREGRLLYRDPGHLSLDGSRYLGDRLNLSAGGSD